MKSDTDCWSNQQLNDRIELLEYKLTSLRTMLDEWITTDGTLENIIGIVTKITEPSWLQ